SPRDIIADFDRSQNPYVFSIEPFRMFNHDHRIHPSRNRRPSHDLNSLSFLDIQRREIPGLYLAYGLQECRYLLNIFSSDPISIAHRAIEWRLVRVQRNGLSNNPFQTLPYRERLDGPRRKSNPQAMF